MEVCGGHTHAIYRFGLKDLLPPNIELIHGPGCPVCVLPMGRIDDGLSMAEKPDVIFTAFGDMMRVPGAHGSPLEHKARGHGRAHRLFAVRRAEAGAQTNPDKHVMFFAIGFETTAPSTALTLMRARAEGIRNFSVFCNHVTIIPAIRAILDSPDMRIDAFIGPGHVSTVIGCRPYEWIAQNEGKPIVVSGFEPLDMLQSIVMLLRQLQGGRAEVENQYKRVVPWEGNRAALQSHGRGVRAAPLLRVARAGFHLAIGAADPRRLCRVGRGAAVLRAGRARDRSQSGAVRRSAERRAEAGAVQAVRQRVHARASGRRADGFVGRLLRGVLQLRASQDAVATSESRGIERRTMGTRLPGFEFRDPQIEMAHGAGGKASRRLVEGLFAPLLFDPLAEPLGDAAMFRSTARASPSPPTASSSSRCAFPGGSIGELAVNGTVNDLAVSGAQGRSAGRHLRARSRAADRGPRSRSARDGAGGAARRRRDRRRRHQGRGARQGRPHVHHDRGHRPARFRMCRDLAAVRAPGRPGSALAGRSAITASRFCWRAASWTSRPTCAPIRARCFRWWRRWPTAAAPGIRWMRDPDARRRRHLAQRTRARLRPWPCISRKSGFRCATRCAAPANCWASTRCISPTKASFSRWSPPEYADAGAGGAARSAWRREARVIGEMRSSSRRRRAGHDRLRRHAASWTCWWAIRCRGSAETVCRP